jgi:hypothetical protein
MPNQNYQVRGRSSRTVLITIRVSPEERELLGQLAEARGETLSRLMVSRSLMLRKRREAAEAGSASTGGRAGCDQRACVRAAAALVCAFGAETVSPRERDRGPGVVV